MRPITTEVFAARRQVSAEAVRARQRVNEELVLVQISKGDAVPAIGLNIKAKIPIVFVERCRDNALRIRRLEQRAPQVNNVEWTTNLERSLIAGPLGRANSAGGGQRRIDEY